MVSPFTHSTATRVLNQLAVDNLLWVQAISPYHPDLRPMLQSYRDKFGIEEVLGPIENALWYGNLQNGKLLSVVGLEENYNSKSGLWLFVRDFVVSSEPDAMRGFSSLCNFMDKIPYMMRGAVAMNNPKMRAFYNRRGSKGLRQWKKVFDIIETGAL